MVGDVSVDNETLAVTSLISRISWLSLSEVLIGIGLRTCINRVECACIFISICICTVFKKKRKVSDSVAWTSSYHA
jgi:hypothetical protein